MNGDVCSTQGGLTSRVGWGGGLGGQRPQTTGVQRWKCGPRLRIWGVFTDPSALHPSDFEAASSKAGKVEAEVKRLHTLIVDINSHKLKAQQDKLDKVNKELDECSSAITKAQVAIKTAGR